MYNMNIHKSYSCVFSHSNTGVLNFWKWMKLNFSERMFWTKSSVRNPILKFVLEGEIGKKTTFVWPTQLGFELDFDSQKGQKGFFFMKIIHFQGKQIPKMQFSKRSVFECILVNHQIGLSPAGRLEDNIDIGIVLCLLSQQNFTPQKRTKQPNTIFQFEINKKQLLDASLPDSSLNTKVGQRGLNWATCGEYWNWFVLLLEKCNFCRTLMELKSVAFQKKGWI